MNNIVPYEIEVYIRENIRKAKELIREVELEKLNK